MPRRAAKRSRGVKRKAEDDSSAPKTPRRSRRLTMLKEESGDEKEVKADWLRGMRVVIAGKTMMTRKELREVVRAAGGTTEARVTSKATHLVLGEGGEGTAIHTASLTRGLPVLCESELLSKAFGDTASCEEVGVGDREETVVADVDADVERMRLAELQAKQLNTADDERKADWLADMRICPVGTFETKTQVLLGRIRDAGGRLSDSVTAETTHILLGAGSDEDPMYKEGIQRGLPVLTEAQLLVKAEGEAVSVEEIGTRSTVGGDCDSVRGLPG